MLAHPVIRMTGVDGAKTLIWRNSVRPSSPVVKREKFMSSSTNCGISRRTSVMASSGFEAVRVIYPARLSRTVSEALMVASSSIINIIEQI